VPESDPISFPLAEPSLPQESSFGTKRRVLAAALSAIVPGAGQTLLGQRRKGQLLLGIFVIFSLGFWPLRLLRFYPGLLLLLWVSILLILYATNAALLARRTLHSRMPSRWWILLSIPLTYVGLNLVFTSLLLAVGFRAMEFNSSAMEPTLLKGDKFMIDRNYYRQHPCEHDDLVFMLIDGAQTVKRVIAVSGDTIEGRDREVFLNGHLLQEQFAYHPRGGGNVQEQDNFRPVTVGAGKYFVMGDNRDTSRDSRMPDFGQVDQNAIVGRPLYIYWGHTWSRNGDKLR
jgi:signal peptidase I